MLVGLLTGTFISLLMVLLEHSSLGIVSYPQFGNGALIVPALLAPFALYPGWVWTLRHGGQALECALFVVGLHFGIGMIAILEVLLFSAYVDYTLAEALPAFLFSGAVFVLPAALLGAVAVWVGSRVRGTSTVVAIVTGLFASVYFAIIFGAGLGILAGGAVAFERRAPSRAALIGAVLLLSIVIVGNLPPQIGIVGAK